MTTVTLPGDVVCALISALRPTCDKHYMSIIELLRGKSDEFLSYCGFPPVPHQKVPREYLECLKDISRTVPSWIIPLARAVGANQGDMPDFMVPDYLVGMILDDGYVVPSCRIDTTAGFFYASGSMENMATYLSFAPTKYRTTVITRTHGGGLKIVAYNEAIILCTRLMALPPTDPLAMHCQPFVGCTHNKADDELENRIKQNQKAIALGGKRLATQRVSVPVSIFECIDDSFVQHMGDGIAQAVLAAGLYELFIKYVETHISDTYAEPNEWLCELTRDATVPEWCLTQKTIGLLCANVQNVYGAIALEASDRSLDYSLRNSGHWAYRCVTYIGDQRYIVGNINIERLATDLDRPETRDIVRRILRRLNVELFPVVVYKQLVALQRKALTE